MRKKHPRKLFVDNNFVPAVADVDDELYPNGIFVFNISKMVKYIQEYKNEIPLENIDVKEYHTGWSTLTKNHINKTNIAIPIILAEISPGRYNVIDGNHRLEKAYQMKVPYIPAYKLIPDHHILFLTSLKAYHAYIEYWNSKLKDITD